MLCPSAFITLIISVKTVIYIAHHIILSILSVFMDSQIPIIVKIVHFECLSLNIAVEWVAFKLHILDILGSSLDQEISYPDQNFS
jgi:hypothetical protein